MTLASTTSSSNAVDNRSAIDATLQKGALASSDPKALHTTSGMLTGSWGVRTMNDIPTTLRSAR